ncbi:pseudouridine synthase [Alteromonas facilis]|uniref:pseudouridine synthase n=1 Tax=Alteromonas facilis TaxID=2048004 RepID=UPI000C2824F6|nr:pseudouridine synthase [Alteromonas facilis]
MTLPIIYRDEHLIAVDKPAGLLVHRSMIAKRETEFAMQMVRDQIGQYVFPVHRLDRPTSGVLLFALDSATAALLTEQFSQREVGKSYQAIVRGHMPRAWDIDYPLKEILDRKTDRKARQDKPPQPAFTECHCIQRYTIPLPVGRYEGARFSYIDLFPKTGRKHQLRRHMAHIRHPIVGDTTHGDGKQNQFLRHHFNFQQLALTCTEMTLQHPHLRQKLVLKAGLSPAFAQLIDNWRVFVDAGNANLDINKKTNE